MFFLIYILAYVPFSAIIKFFSRTPTCPTSYLLGYAYPRFGITDLHGSFKLRSDFVHLIAWSRRREK